MIGTKKKHHTLYITKERVIGAFRRTDGRHNLNPFSFLNTKGEYRISHFLRAHIVLSPSILKLFKKLFIPIRFSDLNPQIFSPKHDFPTHRFKEEEKRTYPPTLLTTERRSLFLQKWSPLAGYLEAGYKGENWWVLERLTLLWVGFVVLGSIFVFEILEKKWCVLSGEEGIFLKTNYKTQTISLVSKRFKLISFITLRVQGTQFRKNWCGENMEIEFNELGFHVQKSSSLNSVSMYRNRVQWTRFPCMENEFIELIFHELSSHGFASEQSWSDVFISLNSAHMGLLDRLVQKIVGCVCRSCNFLWWKTSSKNSFSIHGKRVHWTRFPCIENEFFARSADTANDLLH